MKATINSLAELRSEIARLKVVKSDKENKLKSDIKNLSVELKPVNLIKGIFSSITGDNDLKTQVASRGTEAALGFFLTNILFKNANPVVRTVATIAGTAAASKIFGDETPKYIEKLKTLYNKFKNRKSDSSEINFNESDNYVG